MVFSLAKKILSRAKNMFCHAIFILFEQNISTQINANSDVTLVGSVLRHSTFYFVLFMINCAANRIVKLNTESSNITFIWH
jgi:hypothetical protein